MYTILLVEDHAVCREPLAKLLEYEGFSVITAENGVEALQVFNDEAPVDLLLFDLIMPKMSGPKLLQAVRKDTRWQHLPAIVMTGSMDASLIAKLSELNVRDIFSKMRFSMDEQLASIRACVPAMSPR